MRTYNEIIKRKCPVSLKHRAMPRLIRAAQFSPFAALSGFDEIIDESAKEVMASEERKSIRNEELMCN